MTKLVMPMCALFAIACEAPGVGDPCIPEQIPPNGFDPRETSLETSSVQCRTRVCMVHNLAGIPQFRGPDDDELSCNPRESNCATEADTEERVYCTCRCAAPPGVKASLCECPDGFECVEVMENNRAPVGVAGSYCVRS
jgi:hypothetical protein